MNAQHKPQRVRSPSYPYINLETAVDKLQTMYDFTHKTPVMVATMLPHWGFETGKSANGMKLIAALKSFGLIDTSGKKDQRKIEITDTGFKIINLEMGSESRNQLIKECALKPEMYQYMWNYYEELPHFEAIKSHLVVDKRFNGTAVKGFLNDYKRTIEYANLSRNNTLDGEQEGGEDTTPPPNIDIGDLIQWESDGALRLPSPKKVRALKEYEGRDWVFIDGHETGIPMDQVILEQKGTSLNDGGVISPPILKEEKTHEEMSISNDEREWIRGPLSKDVGYRIIVSGDLGPKEIGKMIRLLETQRDILSDDD